MSDWLQLVVSQCQHKNDLFDSAHWSDKTKIELSGNNDKRNAWRCKG